MGLAAFALHPICEFIEYYGPGVIEGVVRQVIGVLLEEVENAFPFISFDPLQAFFVDKL